MPHALSSSEIRERFLAFFAARGHLRYPSDSLIPKDPTLLCSVAGMVQFKPYFLGATPRFPGIQGEWPRVVTAQKCLRIGDIENVGRTARHNSFFEMLGNFSFGDYFKREAVLWAWEFLTSPEAGLGLEGERLYATVYQDDQEAYQIWVEELGLPEQRVLRFGADENFWPADAPSKGPNGPCGPCSEVFYDRGPAFGSDTWQDYARTRESDRFVEVWNLVFPQFDRADGGVLNPLPYKNIDTGLGLYRAAAISQAVPDLYETDLFKPLILAVCELSGRPYLGAQSLSHRVIADHIRAVTVALADGVVLSNTGRGYVIRKLLRRASRHAYLLGQKEPLLFGLVPLVVETLADAYPELERAQLAVAGAVRAEEERFLATLEHGTARLEARLADLPRGSVLDGAAAFTLYDTYGFPLDLTEEVAAERGVEVDRAAFEEALRSQQERARAGSKFGKAQLFGEVSEVLDRVLREAGETRFLGYAQRSARAKVLALLVSGEEVSRLPEGVLGQVVLDQTPCYPEGGGQVGDSGSLRWPGGEAEVLATRRSGQGLILQELRVLAGGLELGQEVEVQVSELRNGAERHHTATHLLQAALREVLGEGVHQAGSLVTPTRLRFDFTHPAPLSGAELAAAEELVSEWAALDAEVSWRELPQAEAKALGAMALFGEKYGEVVRMVEIPGPSRLGRTLISRELCGGTHLRRTGQLGAFVIVSEEALASGVRRLEALAGPPATRYLRAQLARLSDLAQALGGQVEERLGALQRQLAEQGRELQGARQRVAELELAQAQEERLRFGDFEVAALRVSLEGEALRGAADRLLERSGADLAAVVGDRGLVVKASREAVGRGAHAGRLAALLAGAAGGRGGGRPELAQAGLTFPERALERLREG